MKGSRDYYQILGLRRGSSLQEIKNRFRQLALRYHPDRNPGDPASEERFKRVAEAYHVLSNQRRRHLYDSRGYQGLAKQGYRGFQKTEDVLKTFASEFFDFLGISAVGPQRGPVRGADLCYELELSFEEAALGVKKNIQIDTMETCSHCRGHGVRLTSELQVCPWCRGRGNFRDRSGIFAAAGVCPKCNGKGSLRQRSCSHCDGGGRRQVQKALLVNIPAGVENNTRLKIAQQGDGGEPNGDSGDLYMLVHVRPHHFFTRSNQHVVCRVTICASEAKAGCTIQVQTLRGDRTLEVPPGTCSGAQFCLPDEGIEDPFTSKRGAQIVNLHVSE